MPVLDAVFVGKIHIPEVYQGPILPPGGGGDGGGGTPTHPIYWPPVISGGPGSLPPYPAHPIAPGGAPGVPTHPIYIPGFPTHPIVLPPGFIDGVHPEHPIVIPPPAVPGYPSHPIVLPPEIWPPDARPEHPIVIPLPPVVYPPRPTHPIALPPGEGGKPDPKPLENWDVIAYWTPEAGWAMAIVPSESHPGVPTPSK